MRRAGVISSKQETRTDSASRIVAAFPDRVYAAFADGSILTRWLPPGGMTRRALAYDFSEGGEYRIELTYKMGTPGIGKSTDRSDVSHGRFVSLVPSRRIEQTVAFEAGAQGNGGEMVMTWTFEPVDRGTRVTITAENVPSSIGEENHRKGINASLDNLAAFVAD